MNPLQTTNHYVPSKTIRERERERNRKNCQSNNKEIVRVS